MEWMYNIRGYYDSRKRLQFPLAFIGRAVYPVRGKGMGAIVILAR